MPDTAKFAKLREIGYRIPVVCGLCQSGRFSGQNMWGRCHAFEYEHGKHTGTQQLGVHRYGTCDSPIPKHDADAIIQSYMEFADPEFAKWSQSESS